MAKRNTTLSFREALKERYGTKCYICGEEGAEYHHVVPLWMGGEDTINNFIPLCRWHHMLCHKGHSMRGAIKGGGRKRATAKVGGYKYILDDYIECRIGTQECKRALGISDATGISDRKWFREYLKEKGIKAHRNNVDILRSRVNRTGKRQTNVVGWIEYNNGNREEFVWEDLRELNRA